MENSETPALGFEEAPVLVRELEFDELVEEFELPPVRAFAELSEPKSNDWALAVAEARIDRIRIDQTLMAERSIEESSGGAISTLGPNMTTGHSIQGIKSSDRLASGSMIRLISISNDAGGLPEV